MSEDNPNKEDNSNKTEVPVALQSILEAANASKAQLDALVEATKGALVELEELKSSATTAKNAAENSASEADKAKTAAATARGAIESLQKTADTDVATVAQSKSDIAKLQKAAAAKAESLTAEQETVASKIKDLENQIKPLTEALAAIEKVRSNAEADQESVTESVKTIDDARKSFEALQTQTQQEYDNLIKGRETLDSQISDISTTHAAVKNIYEILVVDSEGKKSVKTEVGELKKQIQDVLDSAEEQREEANTAFEKLLETSSSENTKRAEEFVQKSQALHASLEGEIRTLLPSAGAAGLASTYYDAKSRYAPTSFSEKPGILTNGGKKWWKLSLKKVFGYNPASVVATGFFYILFIVPILGIVYIFYGVLNHLPDGNVGNLDLKILALRVLIALPLATISAFGFTSLRLYRRLYEEYNHKQRVMELYTSFRKEIEESGTEEQKKRLLTIMLEAVADKSYLATGAVESKDEEKILDKLSTISSLLNNLTKLKVS